MYQLLSEDWCKTWRGLVYKTVTMSNYNSEEQTIKHGELISMFMEVNIYKQEKFICKTTHEV